jgi:4'-phosphopantetheinyl transferase
MSVSNRMDLDGVHVWQAHLSTVPLEFEDIAAFLPKHELEQARSRWIPSVKDRYEISRIFLRTTLSSYLGINATDIAFELSQFGKPYIAKSDLEFNLTHSGNLALLAVASRRGIGIDVEQVSTDPPVLDIARRFFSTDECVALEALPSDLLLPAFYATWTRKEAFLKGVGLGIAGHLAQFAVSVSPLEPAAVLRVDWEPSLADRWDLYDLEVDEGYCSCLAVDGHQVPIRCFSWPLHENHEGCPAYKAGRN